MTKKQYPIIKISLSLLISIFAVVYLFSTVSAIEIAWNPVQNISTTFNDAQAVVTIDMDKDGDLDVVGAATAVNDLLWWENSAGDGSAWIVHTVDANFSGITDISIADFDKDGDPDIVASSTSSDSIAWWENSAGDGSAWTKRTFTSNFGGASGLHTADLDHDGDQDIIATAELDNSIVWWQNPLTSSLSITTAVYSTSNWLAHTVDSSFAGANRVTAADFDNDGDLDLLATANVADDVAVWQNVNGDGLTWSKTTLNANFQEPTAVFAADMDGDGDMDALGTASTANDVIWWENSAGDGSTWVQTVVDADFAGASSIAVADMDRDGDADIVAAGSSANEIAWWDNTASDGSAWAKYTLDSNVTGAASVHIADLDWDGDVDVVTAASTTNSVSWWQNDTIHSTPYYPTKHIINATYGGFEKGIPADLDGDGDMDVYAYSSFEEKFSWFENSAGDGTVWTETVIATIVGAQFYGEPQHGDMDGDGDLDLVAAPFNENAGIEEVIWYENTAGDGSAWTEHLITPASFYYNRLFDEAHDVYLADMNNDGALDVLVAVPNETNSISGGVDFLWYENALDDAAVLWIPHFVDWNYDNGSAVFATDIDGDGDQDFFGGSLRYGAPYGPFTLYENTGACLGAAADPEIPHCVSQSLPRWDKRQISNYTEVYEIRGADLDRDGDQDLITAKNNNLDWWENTNGDGTAFTISEVANKALSVDPVDLDFDGDIDIIRTFGNQLNWVENTAGDASVWTGHFVTNDLSKAWDGHAADMDGDGDLDLLVAGGWYNDLQWWENKGGQFSLPTTDTSPITMTGGMITDVLRVELTHLGRSGDAGVEWATVELQFGDVAGGDALTTAETNYLFNNITVYRDDGDNLFDAGSDTAVYSEFTFNLTNGLHTMVLPDNDVDLAVSYADYAQTYFIVPQMANKIPETMSGITAVSITHITEDSSTAEHVGADLPLQMQFTPNVTATFNLDVPPGPILCFVSVNGSGTTDYDSLDASAIQTAVNNANAGDLLKVAGTCAGVQAQDGATQTVYLNKDITIQGGYTNTNWLLPADSATYSTTLDAEGNGRVVYIPNGDANPAGYWKVDEGSGTTASDSSGNGHDMSLLNGLTYTSTYAPLNFANSYALDFDGVNNYGTMDTVANAINNDVSIALWVKAPIQATNSALLAVNTASGGNVVMIMFQNGDTLSVYDGANGTFEIDSLTAVADDTWHHIAYTSDGSTGTLYVDGVFQGTHTVNYTFSATDLWSTGQEFDPGGPTPSNFLTGQLDDIRVYDYVISTNDVTQLADGFSPVNVTLDSIILQNGYTANEGGGISSNSNSTLTVTQSTITDNDAPSGAGLYNLGTVIINQSVFANNSASTNGGGIFSPHGSVTLNSSTFRENSAHWGGGVYVNNNSGNSLGVINSSTFVSNTATANGGGLFTRGPSSVSNCTFSGNSATNNGGGIFNTTSPGLITVTYTTVSNNSAGSAGGNIYNGGGIFNLAASIVADNTGGADCAGSGIIDNGNNLVEDGSCSFPVAGDLGLLPLADNGGDTWTHALQVPTLAENSISVGVNGCGTTVVTDQRGITRPQGSACDIGAYENNVVSLSGSVTLDGVAAVNGTVVAILRNGAEVTTTLVSAGQYQARLANGSGADVITFAVDGYEMGETAVLQANGTIIQNISNGVFAYADEIQTINGNTDAIFYTRDNNASLIINANNVDLGNTTVTVRANQDCTTVNGEAVARCFDITPTNSTGRNATITFTFYESQIPAGQTCATMEVYHWDGSSWSTALSVDGRNCSSAPFSTPHTIRVTGVNSFSPFVLKAGAGPTAVSLQTFTTKSGRNGRFAAIPILFFLTGIVLYQRKKITK